MRLSGRWASLDLDLAEGKRMTEVERRVFELIELLGKRDSGRLIIPPPRGVYRYEIEREFGACSTQDVIRLLDEHDFQQFQLTKLGGNITHVWQRISKIILRG
jgi:hypothetical protein